MRGRGTGISRSRGVGKRRVGRSGRGLKGVTAAIPRPRNGTFSVPLPRMRPILDAPLRAAKRRRVMPRRRQRGGKAGGMLSGEMTFAKRRYGRPKRLTLSKLQRMTMTTAVLRFQGMKRYGALARTLIDAGPVEAAGVNDFIGNTVVGNINEGPGFFILPNINSVTTNAAIGDAYPVRLFDLTTMPNRDTGDTVGFLLKTWNVSATVTDMLWDPDATCNGQQPVSTLTRAGWNFEYSGPPVSADSGTGTILPNAKAKYIKHEWFDIRMLLYGARTQPCYYDVMVVQFKDAFMMPELTAAQIAQLSAEDRSNRNATLQSLVRNITFNPILAGGSNAIRGMRVLRRYRFLLQASKSDEADRTPDHKVLKFFYRDGVIRNYDFGARPLPTSARIDSADYSQNIRITDLQNNPRAQSRTFLMVRASNTIPDDAADFDTLPTFDCCIRKKVRFEPLQ